jgi:hypothetical protein
LLKHDDLDADNRFDQVVQVRDQVRVLVVDGVPNEREPEKAASYYLLHALRPVSEADWGNYHIQPRVVTPRQAVPALLTDKELCILVNVGLQPGNDMEESGLAPEFLEQLAGFVREGHGLLILGGSHVVADPYNRLLFDQHGLLPMKLAHTISTPPDKPLRLDPASVAADSSLASFREEPLSRIGEVEVLKALDVEERRRTKQSSEKAGAREDTEVSLRYSNGRPALLTRRLGDGQVMMLTTGAEPGWTDWPLRPTFLPFVHVALGHLLQEQTGSHNRVAGEPLVWHPADKDADKPFVLVRPDGSRERLGIPERLQDHLIVTTTDTPRAGIYQIAPAAGKEESESVLFAVVPDLRESENLETLSDAQLDERLGFKPIHLTTGDDLSVFSGTERLKQEWTIWFLAAVLALALGETALAWFCGRAW